MFIDSVEMVQKLLKARLALDVKTSKIYHIMRRELRMRYRKVNPLTINTNSERNLILRQQFALAFLKLDLSKKTIINIDETWLGMSDFRRRKWALPKSTDSVERALIQPRISMIAALHSDG